jgi:predicted 3-demethylubiquinone-9 3-methyltransferase (glyoxalase superfamily)
MKPSIMPGGSMASITPFLWFDGRAYEAATWYASIFPGSRIEALSYRDAEEIQDDAHVFTVSFTLMGQGFIGLNAGPEFPFTEAVSFSVACADQAEIDFYWDRLGSGGSPGRCGWLKDRFGLSWQVVPANMAELMRGADEAASRGKTEAMLAMTKLDIRALQEAGL